MFYKNNGRKRFVGSSLSILCALFMLVSVLPQTVLADTPTMDVLYDGTMVLAEGETFEVIAPSGESYDVSWDTPLGALQTAADAEDFTYAIEDKNFENSGALLLDDIGEYIFDQGGKWYAYVNGVFKDGFNNPGGALNLIPLVNGDRVEFYYVKDVDKEDYDAVKVVATAAVKVEVADSSVSNLDILYDGTVSLTPGETFEVTAFSGVSYDVGWDTPLGALQTAAIAEGFTYAVGDKNFGNSGALLLDDIGVYSYVNDGDQWSAFVNGVFKDGFNNPDGALNLIQLSTGDRVEFYYVDTKSVDKTDYNAVKAAATAAVKTVVDTGGAAPTDWTLRLSGARDETVTKSYFEQGMGCSSSHRISWTDDDNNVWEGVPLWMLVGMVDDNPDTGSFHSNFNDDLADKGYSVKVIAGDGWDTTLESTAIARDDGYIVANTLNGEPLPLKTEGGKDCWPLHLKGSKIHSGQQVGNIVRIELVGLPEPSEGWELELLGKLGGTITQKEFEKGLACGGSGHYVEWTDNEDNIWSGIPLRALVGAIDDIEEKAHWTFNDSVAEEGYTVKVIAGNGFSRTFDSVDVAKGNDYIVANKINGEFLSDEKSAPLRLVGAGVAKEDGSLSGNAVGNIVRIEIPELQTPPAEEGSWNLALKGKISYVFSQDEFEEAVDCHHEKQWEDSEGNIWSGIPLRLLAGWVDDWQPHKYDKIQAMNGYKVIVKAGDGYCKDFNIKDIDGSSDSDYIIANKCNGQELTGDSWPLRLVGAGVSVNGVFSGNSVGNLVEIELTEFEAIQPLPEVRIVKYAEDGTTILDEVTVDYMWMEQESNFDVIGDGETIYRFEGITNNPNDIWDRDETYPGGFKIEDAIKGTRIRDLCSLVGHMGTGTEIVFVAKDGWETRLPYSSIYPDPSVQERQGDAVLAWFANGKYVPDYRDGMRLFFTPDDHIYGQWDMHETLPSDYWHYYYGGGVQYPSCAGLSAKYITEIRIYSVPFGDWTFELDGQDIGGTYLDVSKTYFEQALTCTFGANHKAVYTDSKDRVWEGMPLWFLVGYVDDEDEHSSNAFNLELAQAGYDIVITASDGSVVTIDSENVGRNTDYIVANTLDGAPIPESDKSWPLRLVGPAVSGSESISGIVKIELKNRSQGEEPLYTVTPVEDEIYTISETAEGISKMTVKENISGLKFFSVNIIPIVPHSGYETAVFTHLGDGSQLAISAIKADFDLAGIDFAQAGFNVEPGDVIKVYLVDELNNSVNHNPVIFQ